MKQYLLCLLSILIFTTCKREPSVLLAQRWDFVAIDMPKLEKFLDHIGEESDNISVTMQKLFLGNKLILRKDSTFDLLLMKQYVHGIWKYDKTTKNIHLFDESAKKLDIQFGVDTLNSVALKIDTDEFAIEKLASGHVNDPFIGNYLFGKSYYQFYLKQSDDHYSKASEDPYSKENNWWRIKPSQPESDEQIKKRVLNHLNFWRLIFHDADKYQRPYVSYNWFASPLVVASNGVVMKLYDDVKNEWDENFYDSVQAHRGYELMRKCFSKKIKYLETDNKYRRDEDIIKQLTSNFLEATGMKKE